MLKKISLFLICGLVLFSNAVNAWHDKTHIALGLAIYGSEAGFRQAEKRGEFSAYYDLAAPDLAKIRSCNEACNHYYNKGRGEPITKELVARQTIQVGQVCREAEKGRLYGAIVESLRKYIEIKAKGGFADYYMTYVGHYAGDLVMPLHNTEFSDMKHHSANDAVVEKEINITTFNQAQIEAYMKEYTLNSEDEVIAKMIELANESSMLGYKLLDENGRTMTAEEAYAQLGAGASFFKAVQAYAQKAAHLRDN